MGSMHALVGVGEHAFDEVGGLVRLGEVDLRMQGAIGVPEGKDGVVGKPSAVWMFWSRPR